jgi:MFS family permease
LGFVFVERRGKHPMVPPSLFRSRDFGGVNLVTLLFYMALTGSLYFLPFLMMQVHGYSAFVAGSVFLPFVAMAFLLGRLSGRIVARFGTKVPLVVASLAIVVGLLLFALPGVEGGSYWTSFFPAMVVQGFGMALVITPLTTVALGSVEGEHSGLASGVNNAMTRVAGLLAVAVLGVVLYGAFSTTLDARLQGMDLSGEVRSELEAAKADLGAAEAPEGVDAETGVRIERAIDEAFVAGFRAVMLISAGLALASALGAALLVGDGRVRSASRDFIRQTDIGRKAPVLRTAFREEEAPREGRTPTPVPLTRPNDCLQLLPHLGTKTCSIGYSADCNCMRTHHVMPLTLHLGGGNLIGSAITGVSPVGGLVRISRSLDTQPQSEATVSRRAPPTEDFGNARRRVAPLPDCPVQHGHA